jgi:hypothetical protein
VGPPARCTKFDILAKTGPGASSRLFAPPARGAYQVTVFEGVELKLRAGLQLRFNTAGIQSRELFPLLGSATNVSNEISFPQPAASCYFPVEEFVPR